MVAAFGGAAHDIQNSKGADDHVETMNRGHRQVDAEEHGPASLALVKDLCENNQLWIEEAKNIAIEAINARIEFWNDITDLINVSYENA